MKEKDIQTLFLKHLKKNPLTESAVCFELKLCKEKSMPFNQVADHQLQALREVVAGGFVHKISDSPWTQKFTLKKPFDCFYLNKAKAYIAICFYKPRKTKEIVLIPVQTFDKERLSCGRKSLKEDRAREIADKVIAL